MYSRASTSPPAIGRKTAAACIQEPTYRQARVDMPVDLVDEYRRAKAARECTDQADLNRTRADNAGTERIFGGGASAENGLPDTAVATASEQPTSPQALM